MPNLYFLFGNDEFAIARKLKVSRDDLAQANYLAANAHLAVGQQLIIPREPTTLLAARTDSTNGTVDSRATDTVVATSAVVATAARGEEIRIVHRVKRGETLASIAKMYRTSIASVKESNRMHGNVVAVGQRLTIITHERMVATN